MPRTLDAALLAAMNAGSFTPYFKLQLLDDDRTTVLFETEEVTGFELNGLTARVSFHDPNNYASYTTFRLQRGVLIAGTPNYITSSQYYPIVDRHQKRIRTIEGHVFPDNFYTAAGDVSYSTLIEAICTAMGLGVVYADAAADYLSYQFYPTGRQFTINNARQFFTVMRQKYLIFATDYDDDNLYFFQAKGSAPAAGDYTIVTPGLASVPGIGSYKLKSFLSRDELGTTHTSGDATKPMHNLGFLPSTAAHPDRYWFYDVNDWIVTDISPNLKYLDFDPLRIDFDIVSRYMYPSRVREVFDKKLHPSWQWQARDLDVFANTEGGAIPSTIEAAAPYTPLSVLNFDKNLNGSQNNLQALADKVDELDCGPAIYADTAKTVPDNADILPLVDSLTATHLVRKISFAQLKAAMLTMGTISGDILAPTNSFEGAVIAINDDAAISFTPENQYGILIAYRRNTVGEQYGICHYKTPGSGAGMTKWLGSALFDVTTGVLNGTTGVDTHLTVSAHTDGKIYIENRGGAATTFCYLLLGG